MKYKRIISIVIGAVISTTLLTGCFNNERVLTISEDTTNDGDSNIKVVEEDLKLDIGDKIFNVGFGYEDKVYGILVEPDNRGRYTMPVGELVYIDDGALYETGKTNEGEKYEFIDNELKIKKDYGEFYNSTIISTSGRNDLSDNTTEYEMYNWITEEKYRVISEYDSYISGTNVSFGSSDNMVKGMEGVTYSYIVDSNSNNKLFNMNFMKEDKSLYLEVNDDEDFDVREVVYIEELETYFVISNRKIYELNLLDEKMEIVNSYEISFKNNLYDIENIHLQAGIGDVVNGNKVIFEVYEDKGESGISFAGLILYDFDNMTSYDIYTNANKEDWYWSTDCAYLSDVSKEGVVVLVNNNTLTIGQILDNKMEILKDIKFEFDSENERFEIRAKFNKSGDSIIASALVFNKTGQKIQRTYYKQYNIEYKN